MAESDTDKTLSNLFDEQLKNWEKLNNSYLSQNSDIIQAEIEKNIKELEKLTIYVSYANIFSSNEELDDIATESLKFLLLPALLGLLVLKINKAGVARKDILKKSDIYFKDFLDRCNLYELTNAKINENKSAEILRQIKIDRFRECQVYKKKVNELKNTVKTSNADANSVRDYYIAMVKMYICEITDERDSSKLELSLLESKSDELKNDDYENLDGSIRKIFQPFLIVKDKIQKRVFGAGYPSLPVLSVEEFYEERVKEGIFPPGAERLQKSMIAQNGTLEEKSKKNENDHVEKLESDSEEERERLLQRDEWRYTHRTGWGNTYNRS